MIEDSELRRLHLPVRRDCAVLGAGQIRHLWPAPRWPGDPRLEWNTSPACTTWNYCALRSWPEPGLLPTPQSLQSSQEARTSWSIVPAEAFYSPTCGRCNKRLPLHRQGNTISAAPPRPFPAYMAATEPIGTAAVQAILPGGQIVSDSLENMFYVRAAPSGDRLLFGGLTVITIHSALHGHPTSCPSCVEAYPRPGIDASFAHSGPESARRILTCFRTSANTMGFTTPALIPLPVYQWEHTRTQSGAARFGSPRRRHCLG